MSVAPTVLLVDDEPDTVRLVRKILQADGCAVVEAVDGDTALRLYQECRPDLVLLDIILPGRDGLDVLREIRRHDEATGIIMVSALTSERMTIDAMVAGADDYISKPFPLREMRVRIRQVLDKTILRRENECLQRQLQDANARIRDLVERFLPAQVTAELMGRAEPPALGVKRQEITVLYADLQGFTPLAESLQPDRLVEILNDYLQLAASAIERFGGTVDKFVGDCAIGLFGAPAPLSDHAERAVRAGLELVQLVRESGLRQSNLSVRVGINTGDVVVGTIGCPQLMSYTAIGDSMNLAQRFQQMAGPNEVLIGERTLMLAGNPVSASPLGSHTVRGRNEAVRLFRAEGVAERA